MGEPPAELQKVYFKRKALIADLFRDNFRRLYR